MNGRIERPAPATVSVIALALLLLALAACGDDTEDLENPRVAWSAGEAGSATASSEEIIRLDGKRVSVETTFTDQTTGTTADGTLEATCP